MKQAQNSDSKTHVIKLDPSSGTDSNFITLKSIFLGGHLAYIHRYYFGTLEAKSVTEHQFHYATYLPLLLEQVHFLSDTVLLTF